MRWILAILFLACGSFAFAVDVPCTPEAACASVDLYRGDANGDEVVNISDATFIASYLFSSGPDPECLMACDANIDGQVTVSDISFITNYLYNGGPSPGQVLSIDIDSCSCGIDSGNGCSTSELRGDLNSDSVVNGSDAILFAAWMADGAFAVGGTAEVCLEAADCDGSGMITHADFDYLQAYLYSGGPTPPGNPSGCP